MAGTVTQPIGSGAALTVASAAAIGANPTRTALWFHNPNATLNILVAPANVTTSPGGAGWFLIFPGGFLQLGGNSSPSTTCAWNAAMASGTGNVSVLEWSGT